MTLKLVTKCFYLKVSDDDDRSQFDDLIMSENLPSMISPVLPVREYDPLEFDVYQHSITI